MAELRGTAQRKADVLATLEKNGDAWLATASRSGKPQLIAVSCWWDGNQATIATRAGSPTAQNLEATRVARLALGSTDDVMMIDVTLSETTPVADAAPTLKAGFVKAVGWDPAEESSDWTFFRLRPVEIQAYRGYGELQGRQVMRDSRWLS